MKLLITAINTKYIHSNLAVRYLNCTVQNICDSEICEFSINDNIFSIERDILLRKPDVIAFSCYIWNINLVLELCSDIKKAEPNITIILGGPEVTYNSVDLMNENIEIDYIIKGEGELVFPALINSLQSDEPISCQNITYRLGQKIIDVPIGDLPDFSQIPFPYKSEADCKDKIVYYESSRGCPYSCKYCLSGVNSRVRFKDIDLVKKDLDFFDKCNIPLVKFVDRTFNANKKRANDIWRFIGELKGNTKFHMEITGELLDDDTISVLKQIDAEKLQFEIGVQTTNLKTLSAISRRCDIDKLFYYISRLLDETDIHIHLDLIAGLPYEDFTSFTKSFNDVISLRPHVLQVGFLKLLRGSAMRSESDDHNMAFRKMPPYEIISNKYLSYDEIIFLKDIDFVFDKIYNSGDFTNTLDFLFDKYNNRFEIFAYIVNYFRKFRLIGKSISKALLFDNVYECFKLGDDFEEALRFDYIKALHPGRMPAWCRGDSNFKFSDYVYSFLKNEEYKKQAMPKYYNVPAKNVIKHVRFEKFSYGVFAFDYSDDTIYNVTDYFH